MDGIDAAAHKFKVVLLGEGAVGKSSLLLRYVENKFSPRHLSTVQAACLTKKILVDGTCVDLNIWDTAGQERFHALGPMYYRDSQGALLIFDITDQRSFEKVKVWVKELRGMLKNSVTLMIIGNKTDLERERVIETDAAKEYAASVEAEYRETSAKENLGISTVFDQVTKLMIERKKLTANAEPGSPTTSNRRTRNILVVEDDPTPSKKCC
ncbi:hypothetical protein L596_003061 [Steinernema carpocapsae]|uniref:Ras-related protein Rab-21 n=1 Tax=Steinernema carpocapsae TaxID=34508 RepID=A0A4U8UU79_STECR|nr:hypothetical protein L596_003061 [Steinernema carpocapsae]